MTIDVLVWGERYALDVSQKSKTVWQAGGTYMGQYLVTSGRSPGAAAARWAEAAKYKGG